MLILGNSRASALFQLVILLLWFIAIFLCSVFLTLGFISCIRFFFELVDKYLMYTVNQYLDLNRQISL